MNDHNKRKYQRILTIAVIFAAYFFIFEHGMNNPVLVIIGALAGAWLGDTIAEVFIRRFIKRERKY